MEADLSLAVQNFLRIARNVQNKADFNNKVRQFDQRFIDSYPLPTHHNVQRQSSHQSQTLPPQRPKNPFVINQQPIPSTRVNNWLGNNPNQQPNSSYNYRIPQVPQSRTEQQFYKPNSKLPQSSTNYNMGNYANQGYQGYQGYQGGHGKQIEQMEINFARNFSQGLQIGNEFHQQTPKSLSNSQENFLGNQFLGQVQQDPDYVKYYKKYANVNQPPSRPQVPQIPTPNRFNPFAKN